VHGSLLAMECGGVAGHLQRISLAGATQPVRFRRDRRYILGTPPTDHSNRECRTVSSEDWGGLALNHQSWRSGHFRPLNRRDDIDPALADEFGVAANDQHRAGRRRLHPSDRVNVDPGGKAPSVRTRGCNVQCNKANIATDSSGLRLVPASPGGRHHRQPRFRCWTYDGPRRKPERRQRQRGTASAHPAC
jgi:hypothetical protein